MKKIFLSLTCIAISASLLTGCKTTEENYQRAYATAKAKKTEGLTQEEIEGIKREEATPKTVYNGDSIPIKGMYVRHIEGGENKKALRYNVIVASFKQKFNAQSIYNRLTQAGYNKSVLLADRDNRYYIGAYTTTSLDSAVTVMRKLTNAKTSPVPLKSPYPYILHRP